MKNRYHRTLLASALVLCSAGTVALQPEEGSLELGVDFYQQNDFYTSARNLPESTSRFYERQVNWMLEQGYPPASVILGSVSRGMTLADIAYFMAKAQPAEAEKIYQLSVEMMPLLPGWSCSDEQGRRNRYDRTIEPSDGHAVNNLEQIANQYFDEGKRFVDYPRWRQGEGHTNIAVDELIRFKQQELEAQGKDSWWYRPDTGVDSDVLLVTLYPSERRVLVDARLEDLEAMQGDVPVMLVYAEQGHYPLSDLAPREKKHSPESAAEKGAAMYDDSQISAKDVIARFSRTGQRLSPTRDWHNGDHHLMARVQELQKLFDVPEKDEVPEEDWQRWEQTLNSGIERPLVISLYEGDGDDRYIDRSGLVAVAAQQKLERLPVVFFFHGDQRQLCAQPVECKQALQEAISSGSERDDLRW